MWFVAYCITVILFGINLAQEERIVELKNNPKSKFSLKAFLSNFIMGAVLCPFELALRIIIK